MTTQLDEAVEVVASVQSLDDVIVQIHIHLNTQAALEHLKAMEIKLVANLHRASITAQKDKDFDQRRILGASARLAELRIAISRGQQLISAARDEVDNYTTV